MKTDQRDYAIELMRQQKFAVAYEAFCALLAQTSSDGGLHYMAGQCARFLNHLPVAESHLKSAVRLMPDQSSFFYALGIALQLQGKFNEAVDAFKATLKLDCDMELAYNSLALTQKKMGDFEAALDAYEGGMHALTRRIAKGMENLPENRIFGHRDTRGQIWMKCAVAGAIFLCKSAGNIGNMALPDGDMAIREERLHTHKGLYWLDTEDAQRKKTRLFLPNYFNTLREQLCSTDIYSTLVGNRGTVLELMAQHEQARQHYDEADEFLPKR